MPLRLPRYSLRTLFVVVTVLAVTAFGIREYHQAVRGRERVQIGRVGAWDIETVARELAASGIGWGSQGKGQSESLMVQRKDAERAVKILRSAGVQLRQ